MNWLKRLPTWAKWALGIFAVLVVISAATSSSEDTGGGDDGEKASEAASEQPADEPKEKSGGSEDAKKPAAEKKPAGCGSTATDDCTPRVGPNGTVRVDALVWKVAGAKTAASIGDTSVGLGENANGVFVVVNLSVTSKKDESATLSDDVIGLEVAGGNTYKPDSDGTIASVGAGDEPFFLEDIGPDSTVNGVVVFDVPKSVVGKKLSLSFGELGLGSTKGYIQLPAL